MIDAATHQELRRYARSKPSRADVMRDVDRFAWLHYAPPEKLRALGIGLGLGLAFGIGAPHTANAYNPKTDPLTAPVLWFDMQDAASYTQAGTVTAITNKASGVSWTEATNPPTYTASVINGQPCMTGNGTTKLIKSSEAAVAAALKDNLAYTMFFVVKPVTLAQVGNWFGVGAAATSGSRVKSWGKNTGGTGQYRIATTDDAITTLTVSSGTSTSTTSPTVVEFLVTTSVASIIANGTVFAGANAVAHAPATLTCNQSALFCRPDIGPDTFGDDNIGEVLIYPAAMGTTDRGNIRAYLGNRWGIAVV